MGQWVCHLLARPPGVTESYPNAVSADGKYAIGYAAGHVVIWNLTNYSCQSIDDTPFGDPTFDSRGIDISGDGSIYTFSDIGVEGAQVVFRKGYVSGGVVTRLVPPLTAVSPSIRFAGYLSTDGGMIVGETATAVKGPHIPDMETATYWNTEDFVPHLLPKLSPAITAESSGARSVSDDHKVIVGSDSPHADSTVPVKWTFDGDMWIEEQLSLAGTGGFGLVTSISADGSIAVGRSTNIGATRTIPVYWPNSNTIITLENPIDPPEDGEAFAISNDLLRIIGMCRRSGRSVPIVWTNRRALILPGPFGPLNLDNFESAFPVDTSADGKTIVGEMYLSDPDGNPLYGEFNQTAVWKYVETPSARAPGPRPDITVKETPLVYPPVPTNMTDALAWSAQIARTVNLMLAGKTNNSLSSFTLTPNSTTTILYMSQIGSTSVIKLTPLTENAAHETWYISDRKQGQATISHHNSTSTDRTFSVMVVA